jgi:hypothetical protein
MRLIDLPRGTRPAMDELMRLSSFCHVPGCPVNVRRVLRFRRSMAPRSSRDTRNRGLLLWRSLRRSSRRGPTPRISLHQRPKQSGPYKRDGQGEVSHGDEGREVQILRPLPCKATEMGLSVSEQPVRNARPGISPRPDACQQELPYVVTYDTFISPPRGASGRPLGEPELLSVVKFGDGGRAEGRSAGAASGSIISRTVRSYWDEREHLRRRAPGRRHVRKRRPGKRQDRGETPGT